MYAGINLANGGFFFSRADMIGFSDLEIEVVNNNQAAPERVQQVHARMQNAIATLLSQPAEGKPC